MCVFTSCVACRVSDIVVKLEQNSPEQVVDPRISSYGIIATKADFEINLAIFNLCLEGERDRLCGHGRPLSLIKSSMVLVASGKTYKDGEDKTNCLLGLEQDSTIFRRVIIVSSIM